MSLESALGKVVEDVLRLVAGEARRDNSVPSVCLLDGWWLNRFEMDGVIGG